MKELLNTFFATSKERIANPVIGTFIISWTVFNWKPLIFIIASHQTIENKIAYVDSNFSNIYSLLYYPLIAVIFYVLLIPYINWLFERLLEYQRIKRNIISIAKQKQLIENKKQLAIEEIKLEEAKTEFRERKNHNELVDNLQRQLEEKDNQITLEMEKNKKILANANQQILQSKRELQELSNSMTNQITAYIEENKALKESLHSKEKDLTMLMREQRSREEQMEDRINRLQQENIHLSTELKDLKRGFSQSYNDIYSIEHKRDNNRRRDVGND